MNEILNHRYFENKKLIYYTIFLLNIIVIVSFLFLNSFAEKFSTHNKHITYSITNIKYLSSQSHLWLEEYLNGDNKEYSKINTYISKSIDEVDILLNGGVIKEFQYAPTHSDENIINYLTDLKNQLLKIQELTDLRLKDKINLIELDSEYDKDFEMLLLTLDEVDSYITKKFRKMFNRYLMFKYTIYFSIFLLFLIGLYLIYRLNKEIDEKELLSYVDGLTNIQNLKGYNKEITHLLALYNRYKTPFSIVMFDIDNFKNINDTFGHRIGDIVLKDLVKLVNAQIRHDIDMQCRVGGEEFVILCPNTSLESAKSVAEKIRKDIELNLNSIKNKTITVSIGVTEVSNDDDEDTLYRRVDRHLYYSKNNGKNRVTSEINNNEY